MDVVQTSPPEAKPGETIRPVRLIANTSAVIIISIGVAVTVLGFLFLDSFAGDPEADDSQSVVIVYDEAADESPAAPPHEMTELMDLRVWLGLLSINLGLAAALATGLVAGTIGWRRHHKRLPPLPGSGPTARSFVFAALLTGASYLVTQRIDAIGALELQPPIEPQELVPRVFEVSGVVTGVAFAVALLGAWALLWLREAAGTGWAAGVDQRRAWIVACRSGARAILAGLSLMIVAAVFATGALVNLVEVAFGDAITVVGGVAVMFGVLLSTALALTYLPTHTAIERQVEDIVDEVAPIVLDPVDPDAYERRKLVAEALNAGQSGRRSLEENLLIAGPLLSSVVTVLLG